MEGQVALTRREPNVRMLEHSIPGFANKALLVVGCEMRAGARHARGDPGARGRPTIGCSRPQSATRGGTGA
jgi:hypothetical protein